MRGSAWPAAEVQQRGKGWGEEAEPHRTEPATWSGPGVDGSRGRNCRRLELRRTARGAHALATCARMNAARWTRSQRGGARVDATGGGGGGFGSKVSVRTLVTGRWWPMWSSFGRWLWTGVDEGAQWCWAPAWTSDGEVVRWRCSGRPARHRLLARWSRAGDWLGGDEVAALGGGHGAAARVGVGASSRAAKETGERQMEAGGVPIRRRLDGDAAAWAEQGMAQCVRRVPERTTRAANDR
jgi:hypothetical protein